MATTVRVVVYADSPFEPQWDDQVLSPRREDSREFVAGKVQDMKDNGIFHIGEHVITATVSLQFRIEVLPGIDPSMG
jgi:hypothetical protein